MPRGLEVAASAAKELLQQKGSGGVRRCAKLPDCHFLGRMPYADALKLQQETVAARLANAAGSGKGNLIYMLEHPHVYTLGRRKQDDCDRETEKEEARLRALSTPGCPVEFHRTQRGGKVTYHGPGQIVAYPILNLQDYGLTVREYVAALQQAVLEYCLHEHNINASTCDEHAGVWVGQDKICAVGVRVQRYVTSHGIALNYNPDLQWFRHIVPCGIKDRGVTSVAQILQSRGRGANSLLPLEQAAAKLAEYLANSLTKCKKT